MRHSRAVVGYALSVFATAAVTLALIPVVVRYAGDLGWASLAVGQAIGTSFAVVVGFGWGATGPSQIANAHARERFGILVDSVRARGVLAVPLTLCAGALAFFVTEQYSLASLVTAVSYCLTGLLAGWYFTGEGKPYALLVWETLPRVAGSLVGALMLTLGGDVVLLPVMQGMGVVVAFVMSMRAVRHASERPMAVEQRRSVRALLTSQSHGFAITGVSVAYLAAPISIVAIIAPSGLPTYALADKLMRFGTTVFAPFVQFLQGWVPSVRGKDRVKRVRVAVIVGAVGGLTGGVAFASLIQFIAPWLSHGEILVPTELAVLFGGLLSITVLAQIIGLVGLVSLGHVRALAIITVSGAAVGMPAVFLGAVFGGSGGAVAALLSVEAMSLVIQVLLLIRYSRGGSTRQHVV